MMPDHNCTGAGGLRVPHGWIVIHPPITTKQEAAPEPLLRLKIPHRYEYISWNSGGIPQSPFPSQLPGS